MDGTPEPCDFDEVPELVPVDEYDTDMAKLQASVTWLLAKAYPQDPPPHHDQPFYETNQGRLCLKPAVVGNLISGEVYCRACARLFTDTSLQWKGHPSVLHALARRGVYVVDPKESDVTESVLSQTSPFKLSSHLALIDALMMAYSGHLVTVEKVVQGVRKFASFTASSELPYDLEDAILFWVNKVCGSVRHKMEKGELAHPTARDETCIPVMDDLLKDLSDGCCMAVLLCFYCPQLLHFQDVALKENVGIADSLYNLQLVAQFCQCHLAMRRLLFLSITDLFYSRISLKPNILVLLAELFNCLEGEPLDCVRDITLPLIMDNPKDQRNTAHHLASTKLPISNATKRSFQQGSTYSSRGDVPGSPDKSAAANRQPLLPRRQQQQHQNGMQDYAGDNKMAPTTQAWGEDQQLAEDSAGEPAFYQDDRQSHLTGVTSLQDSQRSGLLANVSMDSDGSMDFTESSVDLSEFENTPRQSNGRNLIDPAHPDYLELESVSSRPPTAPGSCQSPPLHGGNALEPLIPAHVRPAKEKTNNHHTKEMESGESPTSRNKPASLTFNNPHGVVRGGCDGDGDSSEASTPSEEYKTPSVESMPLPGAPQSATGTLASQQIYPQPSGAGQPQVSTLVPQTHTPKQPHPKQAGQAQVSRSKHIPQKAQQFTSKSTTRLDRSKPVAQSFSLHSDVRTPEAAKAAGIPVVGGSPQQKRIRGGTPTRSSRTDRNGSESSDPELLKIHQDHKDKEVKTMGSLFTHSVDNPTSAVTQLSTQSNITQRPASLDVKPTTTSATTMGRPGQPSPKTSFAEIKKQKDNGEVSPVVYKAGHEPGSAGSVVGFKEQFQLKGGLARGTGTKVPKKTTFANLPNQTTWQETVQRSNNAADTQTSTDADNVQPLASELMDIRMRLEERRKQIEVEKKRMEMQWNKQRQRLGKQAFLKVIAKGKSEEDDESATPEKSAKERAAEIVMARRGSTEASQPKIPKETISKAVPEASKEKSREDTRDRIQEKSEGRTRDRMPEKSEGRTRDRMPEKSEEINRDRMPEKSEGRQSREGSADVVQPAIRTAQALLLPQQTTRSHTQQQQQPQPHQSQPIAMERVSNKQEDTSRSRLRSQSPRSSDSDSDSRKAFNRKDLQQRIEGVKQRWFSDDEGKDERGQKLMSRSVGEVEAAHGERPRSYHGDASRPVPGVMYQSAGAVVETASQRTSSGSSMENMNLDEYSTSLDRLNCSLSDLQGEIMRLSLQQDQIKSLVVNERDPHATQKSPTPGATSSGSHPAKDASATSDKFYLYPHNSAGEPDVSASPEPVVSKATVTSPPTKAPMHATVLSDVAQHTQPSQPSQPNQPQQMLQNTTMPYNYAASQPQVQYPQAPMGQPFGAAAPQYPGQYPQYMPHMGQYPPQQQYPGIPPGYPQTSPPMYTNQQMYQQGGVYPGMPTQHQTQWGHTLGQMPPPASGYLNSGGPSHMAQTSTVTAHHSHVQSPALSAAMTMHHTAEPRADTSRSYTVSSPSLNNDATQTTPTSSVRSPTYHRTPTPQSPPYSRPVTSSPLQDRSPPANPRDEQYWEEQRLSPEPNSQEDGHLQGAVVPGGFFVSMDDESPRRPRPKLNRDRPRAEGSNQSASPPPPCTDTAQEQVKSVAAVPASAQSLTVTAAPLVTAVPAVPSVSFAIGADPTAVKQEEMSEMEKKKQMLIEKHLKRREDQEQKRLRTEAALACKREEQRLKQEAQDQKKLEDKARRDAIYQQYLKRKEDQDSEDDTKDRNPGPVAAVKRRQKAVGKKGARPHSQPPGFVPPPVSTDQHSHSSQSHSSQEDIVDPPKRPSQLSTYRPPQDQVDGGYPTQLAYGGVTHRRPPTPGRQKVRPLSAEIDYRTYMDRAPLNGNEPKGDTAGLKLYVKPSSKSNRNIIMNAISHCCLAGVVNNDVKNKALDLVSKSEAHHFIILFRDAQQQFRSLYTYNTETGEVIKLHGVGPRQLTDNMMEHFYKYNSGSKIFTEITSTKHLSATIDAVTITNTMWQKKPPAPSVTTGRKPSGSPYK